MSTPTTTKTGPQNKPTMRDDSSQTPAKAQPAGLLPHLQSFVFVVSGLWPVVHLRSFEAVTGPKTDGWLVKTVGLLLGVIGAVIGLQARCPTRETALLGGGSAAALAAIDVVYVTKGRISPIYLLDALMEFGFVAGWLLWWRQRQCPERTSASK